MELLRSIRTGERQAYDLNQEEFLQLVDQSLYCARQYGSGDCRVCSLVSYGLDCHNNPVGG